NDAEGFAALFSENGRLATAASKSEVVGRDAIRKFIAGSYAKRPPGMRTKHLYGNCAIELEGDTASAKTDYVIYQCIADGAWEIKSVGQSLDQLVRHDGQWLIAERRNVDARV